MGVRVKDRPKWGPLRGYGNLDVAGGCAAADERAVTSAQRLLMRNDTTTHNNVLRLLSCASTYTRMRLECGLDVPAVYMRHALSLCCASETESRWQATPVVVL